MYKLKGRPYTAAHECEHCGQRYRTEWIRGYDEEEFTWSRGGAWLLKCPECPADYNPYFETEAVEDGRQDYS